MDALRPIGTEFECYFEPDMSCTKPVFRAWTYRVKAHVEAADYPGGPTRLVESLEPLRVKEYQIAGWKTFRGRVFPMPPPEIAHFYAS